MCFPGRARRPAPDEDWREVEPLYARWQELDARGGPASLRGMRKAVLAAASLCAAAAALHAQAPTAPPLLRPPDLTSLPPAPVPSPLAPEVRPATGRPDALPAPPRLPEPPAAPP